MSTGGISRTMRGMMARLAGMLFGGERNLYEQFGYPAAISPDLYRATYARGDLMARIIDAYPEATWRESPSIRPKGAKAGAEKSALELEVEALNRSVDLWGTMQRLDRLMGLGHYGVLMLGLDGAEPTSQPATGKQYRLMYLSPHGETSAQITNWDAEARSPRFGQPLLYSLNTGTTWTGVGASQRALAVHWTRTIHVAERALEDRSIGQPRLERVFNRALDLDKLLGGGAEIYWQNAVQTRAWVADKDSTITDEDKASMKEQLEELRHNLRRDLTMQGVTPHPLTADAQSQHAAALIDKELDFISGATGIPKRILIGSERGELSSEQDENNWSARIVERRDQFVSPYMVRPLVERLMMLGVIRAMEFDIVWPESDTLGEEKRSQIAKNKAEATATYVGTPGTDAVIAPEEFRQWLGEEPTSEYELAPMPEVVEEPLPGEGGNGAAANDPEAVAAYNRRLVIIDNARPRSLYVKRQVVNWREIAAWAKSQGFKSTLGQELHVTVMFSTTPVDWLKVSEPWAQKPGDLSGNLEIAAGGPRTVEGLGDKGAIVLGFNSNELRWRHAAMKDAGAVPKFPEYEPHITLTYDPGKVDVAKVKPYAGPIILGPEMFQEVDDDWAQKVKETAAA